MNTLIRTVRSPIARRWNDEFDNMFEGFLRPLRWADEEAATEGLVPRLDVIERADEYLVRTEIPGARKEDIEVSVENGVLTISAETRNETEQKEGERVIRQERRYGRYLRSLRLDKTVDDRKVKAVYRDGVLELSLPKVEEVKPKKITVNVG
jgi:HSP20 family protein